MRRHSTTIEAVVATTAVIASPITTVLNESDARILSTRAPASAPARPRRRTGPGASPRRLKRTVSRASGRDASPTPAWQPLVANLDANPEREGRPGDRIRRHDQRVEPELVAIPRREIDDHRVHTKRRDHEERRVERRDDERTPPRQQKRKRRKKPPHPEDDKATDKPTEVASRQSQVASGELLVDSPLHLRMNGAVIRTWSDERHRQTESARPDVAGIEFAVIEHHAMGDAVGVVPDDGAPGGDRRWIRRERL